MSENTLTITQAELDTLVAKAKAEGERNAKHIGVPGFAYKDAEDRERQIAKAQEVIKFWKTFAENEGLDRKAKMQALVAANPDLYTKAYFNETTAGNGLNTVPTEWWNDVVGRVEQFGFYQRDAQNFPMGSKTLNIPTIGSTAVTVSWPGEATAPTPQSGDTFFGQTVLTANTAVIAVIITRELLADTSVALVNHITKRTAKAIAKEWDKQGFAGTGSPFTGIVGTANVNIVRQGGTAGSGKTSVSNISWTDINALVNAVTPTFQEGAKFYLSQGAYQYLRNEVDGVNGRPIWNISMPQNQAGETGFGGHGMLMGYPAYVIGSGVFPTDAADKANIVFGNLGESCAFGMRQDVTIDTYDQYLAGVDLSGTNSMGFAIRARVAMGVTQPSALAILKTSVS